MKVPKGAPVVPPVPPGFVPVGAVNTEKTSKGGGKLSILGYGNIGALHVVNTKTLRVS